MSNKDLLDVIKILDAHLVSSNTIRRYSVLKLYNKLLKNPSRRSLMMNISEIERVLSDKNKSLSALAASILLRMCTEGQLDKLFAQISESMAEMSDDYKIDVLNSVKNVIKQYPAKYRLVNSFLARFIEAEKKEEFVRTVIEVMEYEIRTIGGEAKKECLKVIAQLLMKLDFEKVHFQILGIISREVGAADIESDFLKHLVAQIYLQSGAVRACSLSTLQKLSNYPSSKQKLLKRVVAEFQDDEDEEVRYRSVPKKQSEPFNKYELDVLETYLRKNLGDIQAAADPQALDWERIKEWGQNKGAGDILSLEHGDQEIRKQETEVEEETRLSAIIGAHSTFSKYGKLLKVCKPATLTEPDCEFEVALRKLFFRQFLILEYSVTHKIPGTTLEEARVEIKTDSERLKLLHMIPAKQIEYGQTSDIFLGFEVLAPEVDEDDEEAEEESEHYVTATLSSVLKYKLKEVKGTKTISYEDEYPLEDNEITFGDYMSPLFLPKGSFLEHWEKFAVKEELLSFGLPYPNTQAAIKELVRHFGMDVVESGAEDEGKKANTQSVSFSGLYLKSERVLIQCLVGFNLKSGCLLQLKIKSGDPALSQSIGNSIS